MSKAKKQANNTTNNQSEQSFKGREGLVYARVSSKRQEIEGSGLQSQEGRCVKYLESIQVPYIKSFLDSFPGGGDFLDRPAMRELLTYIDAHPFKKFVIVFDDLKRFARDVEFHQKLRRALTARDVVLRCLNYRFDESPEGRFAELIMAGQAELERHQNRRQVIQKQKARLDNGYWAFGAKKGYKMVSDPAHGKISIPHNPDASVLSAALEGFATGKFVRKVDACRFLVENGFWKNQAPERYIDKFTVIARDPFYAGYIEYIEWEVPMRKGRHEGLISLDTFELLKKRLGKNDISKRIRNDLSEDFPLRGLLVCATCKGHMTAAWTKGRSGRHPYYFCQNRDCNLCRKSIRKSDAEEKFLDMLKKHTLKSKIERLMTLIFDRVWSDEVESITKQQAAHANVEQEINDFIKSLTSMAINAKSDGVRAAYENQIEEKIKELEALQLEPIEIMDLNIPYRTALNKANVFLKQPYISWVQSSLIEQHRLFFFIFEEKVPYDIKDGYRTAEIPSYIRLFEEFVGANSHDVEMGGIEPPSI